MGKILGSAEALGGVASVGYGAYLHNGSGPIGTIRTLIEQHGNPEVIAGAHDALNALDTASALLVIFGMCAFVKGIVEATEVKEDFT